MTRCRLVLALFVVVGLSPRGVDAAPRLSWPAGDLTRRPDVEPGRVPGGIERVVATGEVATISAPGAAASGNIRAAPGATPGENIPAAPPAPSAASSAVPPAASSGTAPAAAPATSEGETQSPPVSPLGPEGTDTAATAGVPMVDAAVQAGAAARYGLGVRARWVSVPAWMLGLFLADSVPLSSYTIGGEFFRRSGNFEFVLGVAWQSLSPPDGNWLGKKNPPSTETDFVQFRGFGAVSVDAAFILRTELNEFVSLHYGGGVGIGITTGEMKRTSDGSAGCADNPGDEALCHPVIPGCTVGPCTETQLHTTDGGGMDTPGMPARFSDTRIPPVYPIVNIVTGLDFRIPNMQGFEFKIEGGFFFPYFFLGGGATYRI